MKIKRENSRKLNNICVPRHTHTNANFDFRFATTGWDILTLIARASARRWTPNIGYAAVRLVRSGGQRVKVMEDDT